MFEIWEYDKRNDTWCRVWAKTKDQMAMFYWDMEVGDTRPGADGEFYRYEVRRVA